jgi:hypothetical protein
MWLFPPGSFRQTVMYHGTCRAQIKIFRFITLYFGFGLAYPRKGSWPRGRMEITGALNLELLSGEKRHSISNSEDRPGVPRRHLFYLFRDDCEFCFRSG